MSKSTKIPVRVDKTKLVVTDDHYSYEGKNYDRVSRFTGFTGFTNKAMNQARDRGKALHGYIEKYHLGKFTSAFQAGIRANNPDMYEVVMSYIEWSQKNIVKIHYIEETMLSKKYQVGGTFDVLVDMKDKEGVLIDLKSGGFYKSYYCQIGAYRQLAKENKYPAKYFGVVQLGKETKYTEIKSSQLNIGFGAWCGMLNHVRLMSSL